jgi:hypothetical protein
MNYVVLDNGTPRFATAAETAEIEARKAQAAKPMVPDQVTMRQARLALLGAGLLYQVSPTIDALDSPDREVARIEWDYSSAVSRHRPLVTMLATKLGLSDAQLDDLFITAAVL